MSIRASYRTIPASILQSTFYFLYKKLDHVYVLENSMSKCRLIKGLKYIHKSMAQAV